MADPSLAVFGVRHHGPGCARSLRAALEELEPDIVLVEGPPDAQDVLPLLLDEAMQPPVALLVYMPEAPRNAAFYPFTHYSPEWQALHFALRQGIPARFMDLPRALSLATDEDALKEKADTPARDDPLGLLAEAAGYGDHELWWEHVVEQRQDGRDLFAAILEAMTALRGQAGPPPLPEARREAFMRQTIRAAQREGFQRIAAVCGAWHAPALADLCSAQEDDALLAKLTAAKVQATWIPWTNSRLSARSGYGAGIASPGWYEHLWTAPGNVAIRWVARAARVLRDEGLDAPSSNVIEAVRLGDALAALRERAVPGLAELSEAIQTVLCGGDAVPMALINRRLEIGEALGAVPAATPAVPLQRDLEAQQRRLRLPTSAEIKTLDLDLRHDTDRARSHLLHRLSALGVDWGRLQPVHGKSGSFHELWSVQWQPEFAVALIEANVWGNTIAAAAAARMRDLAGGATDLPRLTALLDAAILADLPDAVAHLLQAVEERAALSDDVLHLMEALPPLARVARYGDVRQTRAEQVLPVINSLLMRIVVGLPPACGALDDDAAQAMAAGIGHANASVLLLELDGWRTEWHGALRRLIDGDRVHGLARGWSCRLLFDQQALDGAALQRLARLALSPAEPPGQAAAWLQGVLRGSGLGLLHQDPLWLALDGWLVELAPETFEAMLPLVRRAFADFQPAERRAMGEMVRRLRAGSADAGPLDVDGLAHDIDRARAVLVLPVLTRILGGGDCDAGV